MNAKINKIFIANRGEILRRICQTAKVMDIATCSYAEAGDLDFIHGLLDDAVFLEHPLTTADYLNIESVIRHAKDHHCDAVHPGFGFLSENADFARAVIKSGMLWIGPNPESMDAMASKSNAQMIAEQHQVPTIPGCRGLFYKKNPQETLQQAQAFIKQHGLPVLIKAAMGGGGKGMRVVQDLEILADSMERASSEALSAFGDDELIIQRYLPRSRHIEVQVMADKHGNVLIVGDRDCSLQRRHQKILEEAPAPMLSATTRKSLHECARKLASSVRYDSAGTVEFLLDWTKPELKEKQDFYFLEMNTRLQVEHPVSEQVFGVDLVRAQISAALGESLLDLLNQETMHPKGHSIEVRIYAEDPTKKFLPSPGQVWDFIRAEGPGVRWECGVEAGSEISTRFDPMVAKLIVWADTRERSIKRLAWALKNSFYAGPPGNFEYLTWLCDQKEFVHSVPATSFIGESLDQFLSDLAVHRSEAEKFFKEHKPIEALQGQLTNSALSNQARVTAIFSRQTSSEPAAKSGFGQLSISGQWARQQEGGYTSQSLRGHVNHNSKRTYFYCSRIKTAGGEFHALNFDGWYHTKKIERQSLDFGSASQSSDSNAIASPVPGKVVKVLAKAGQTVANQEKLLVLESMKMEYEISATQSGVIESIQVQEGMQVSAGKVLVVFKKTESPQKE